jgi:hypothetical protein
MSEPKMNMEQFQSWLKARFNTHINDLSLSLGYVEDNPGQVGGDLWREMEKHGILADYGIETVMDFEHENIYFICFDGVLKSSFTRGDEGQIEWAAEPLYDNELKEANPEHLRLLAKRLNRKLDGVLDAIEAATRSLIGTLSNA